MTGRNAPQKVDGQIVSNVEIGSRATVLGQEVKQSWNRIQECVAGDGAISSINGSTPGVAPSDLKAVTHVFLNLRFEAVEIGVIVPSEHIHSSDVGTNRRVGRRWG